MPGSVVPPALFVAIAVLLLVAACAVTFLKSPVKAAMALGATFVVLLIVFGLLHSWLPGLLVFVPLGGGSAGLFHLAYWRTQPHESVAPLEERTYWGGLVSVLFFVLVYRVIAGSDWGTQDHSQLAAPASMVTATNGSAYVVPGLLLLTLVILGGFAFWRATRRQEETP